MEHTSSSSLTEHLPSSSESSNVLPQDNYAVWNLTKNAGITLEDLQTLDKETRDLFLKNNYDVWNLIKNTGISLKDLLALDKETRDAYLKNSYAVWNLTRNADMPLEDLRILDKETRDVLFKNTYPAWRLVKEFGISLKKLLTLALEKIKQVLSYVAVATPHSSSLPKLVENAAIYAQEQEKKKERDTSSSNTLKQPSNNESSDTSFHVDAATLNAACYSPSFFSGENTIILGTQTRIAENSATTGAPSSSTTSTQPQS